MAILHNAKGSRCTIEDSAQLLPLPLNYDRLGLEVTFCGKISVKTGAKHASCRGFLASAWRRGAASTLLLRSRYHFSGERVNQACSRLDVHCSDPVAGTKCRTPQAGNAIRCWSLMRIIPSNPSMAPPPPFCVSVHSKVS